MTARNHKAQQGQSVRSKLLLSVSANAISLVVSVVLALVVPKLLGVEDYGYWQLYTFYISYVSLLHFGIVDGVLLRLGGAYYDELDFPALRSQFAVFSAGEGLLTLMLAVGALACSPADKTFVLVSAALNVVLVNCRFYLLYVFQATSRVKEYARYTKIDRYIYFAGTMILLLVGVRDYRPLLIVDLLAKVVTLLGCMFTAKGLVFGKIEATKPTFMTIWTDARSGIKLTIAYLSGLLITGIVRFGIEWRWGVTAFGSTSLVLNVSNMLVTFINAASIVLFPILRRVDRNSYNRIFDRLEVALLACSATAMLLYAPMRCVLSMWLPEYKEALASLVILLPMCVFECKVSLLTNTFLKSLREERLIMVANVIAVIVSLSGTVLSVGVIGNLELAMLVITIASAARCLVSELFLANVMERKVSTAIAVESSCVLAFLVFNSLLDMGIAFLLYGALVLTGLFIFRGSVISSLSYLKQKLRG